MTTASARRSQLFAALVAVSALVGVAAAAQAAAQKCTEASECHGPLPHFCMRCGDGPPVCAHWACVDHACVTRTCPR